MIFSEQAAIVLDANGDETDCNANWSDWSDDHDLCALRINGYVVKVNSDPVHVFADYRAAWDIDHSLCPELAHTFDAGNSHYEGRLDDHGRTLCNDCGAIMFYCYRTNWYHHAGAATPPCFLCKDPGQAVEIPASAELTTDGNGHAYAVENDTWHCAAHHTRGHGDTTCEATS